MPDTIGIECALRYRSFEQAAELWMRLANTHPGMAGQRCYLHGEEFAFAEVEGELRRRRADHFSVEFSPDVSDGREIFFGQIANHRIARLEFHAMVGSVDDAEVWVAPLLTDPAFVQARVYDRDYDYWQNAHDPLQYSTAGRSMAGLPMISNGLPYPMEATVIDTSRNPGRSVLRAGYIESVGSVMWLGSAFWEALKRSPPDWSTTSALNVTVEAGLARIHAADHPFNSADGLQGEIQIDMRRAIFGI